MDNLVLHIFIAKSPISRGKLNSPETASVDNANSVTTGSLKNVVKSPSGVLGETGRQALYIDMKQAG